MTSPSFTVFCGPMFSSKTSKLLMSLERYKHQKKRVLAIKPVIDVRYNVEEIVSHSGWKYPATTVSTGAELLEVFATFIEPPDVVVVDEAFMIPGCAEALICLFRSGVTVLVSSVDLSSSCKPFTEVEKMLPWATCVEKCAAVCTMCSNDARYTLKVTRGSSEIEIGGSDMYEPRCACCHGEVLL